MALLADAVIVISAAVGLGLFFVYLVPWAFKKVRRGPATVIPLTPKTETPITESNKSEGEIHHESRQR